MCSVEDEVEAESSSETSLNLYRSVLRQMPEFFMGRYRRCCITLWCYRFLFVSEHVYKNGYIRGRQTSHRSLGWTEEKTKRQFATCANGNWTEQVSVAVTLCTSIRDVPVSNFGRVAGCHDWRFSWFFPQFFKTCRESTCFSVLPVCSNLFL